MDLRVEHSTRSPLAQKFHDENKFFEIHRTPPEEKRRADKAAQLAASQEVSILLLTPFTSTPRISFDKIKLGSSAVRQLIVKNPGEKTLDVSLERLPSDEKGFEVDYVNFRLGGREETTLLIGWTPLKGGNVRDNIVVKFGSFRSQIILIGSCLAPEEKKPIRVPRSVRPLAPKNTQKPKGRPSFPASKLNSTPKITIPQNPVVRKNVSPIKRLSEAAGIGTNHTIPEVYSTNEIPSRRETFVRERPAPARHDVLESTPKPTGKTLASRENDVMGPPCLIPSDRRQTFLPDKFNAPDSDKENMIAPDRRTTFQPSDLDNRFGNVRRRETFVKLPSTDSWTPQKINSTGEDRKKWEAAPFSIGNLSGLRSLNETEESCFSEAVEESVLAMDVNKYCLSPVKEPTLTRDEKTSCFSKTAEDSVLSMDVNKYCLSPVKNPTLTREERTSCFSKTAEESVLSMDVNKYCLSPVKEPILAREQKTLPHIVVTEMEKEPLNLSVKGKSRIYQPDVSDISLAEVSLNLSENEAGLSMAVNMSEFGPERDDEIELDLKDMEDREIEDEIDRLAVARAASGCRDEMTNTPTNVSGSRLSSGTMIKSSPSLHASFLPDITDLEISIATPSLEIVETRVLIQEEQMVCEKEMVREEVIEEVIEYEYEVVGDQRRCVGQKNLGRTVTVQEQERYINTPTKEFRTSEMTTVSVEPAAPGPAIDLCEISRLIENDLCINNPKFEPRGVKLTESELDSILALSELSKPRRLDRPRTPEPPTSDLYSGLPGLKGSPRFSQNSASCQSFLHKTVNETSFMPPSPDDPRRCSTGVKSKGNENESIEVSVEIKKALFSDEHKSGEDMDFVPLSTGGYKLPVIPDAEPGSPGCRLSSETYIAAEDEHPLSTIQEMDEQTQTLTSGVVENEPISVEKNQPSIQTLQQTRNATEIEKMTQIQINPRTPMRPKRNTIQYTSRPIENIVKETGSRTPSTEPETANGLMFVSLSPGIQEKRKSVELNKPIKKIDFKKSRVSSSASKVSTSTRVVACKNPSQPKPMNAAKARMSLQRPSSNPPKSSSSRRSLQPTRTLNLRVNKPTVAHHPNPFASRNRYYDERWVEKQEKGFSNWLNFILTPQGLDDSSSAVVPGTVDVAKLWSQCSQDVKIPRAPTREVMSMRAYTARREMNRLRRASCKLWQSRAFAQVIGKLEVEIEKLRLVVRKDKKISKDVGMKQAILSLILSYNPLWLRVGLETVFGELLPVHGNSDLVGLSRFIVTRLISCPDILAEFAHPTVPHSYREGHQDALNKFTLKKFLELIYFLDAAKEGRLIQHNPCLFCPDSKIKSSRDILFAFSRDYLSGEGDIIKHLAYLGYEVKHKQTSLDEFDYAVTSVSSDLRCGLRLTKVAELLTGANLSLGLRVPAVSRLQKVHNTDVGLKELRKSCSTIPTNVTAKDIVDGHREKTLSLLWNIIFGFQLSVILDVDKLREEILHLKRSLKLRIRIGDETASKGMKFLTELQSRSPGVSSDSDLEGEDVALLKEWAQLVTAHYNVEVENWTVSWCDGRGLCFLMYHYQPALLDKQYIHQDTTLTSLSCSAALDDSLEFSYGQKGVDKNDYENLLENEKKNFKLLLSKVTELGGVPILISPGDMSNTIPDEKVTLTFIGYLAARLLDISREIKAARTIQLAWRKYYAIKREEQIKVETEAANTIQKAVRRFLKIRRQQRYLAASIRIQAAFRGYRARRLAASLRVQKRFQALTGSVIILQSLWRGQAVRIKLRRDKDRIVKIQSVLRAWIARKKFLRLRRSTILLQQRLRGNKVGRVFRAQLEEKKTAAIRIQWAWRRFIIQRNDARRLKAVIMIQAQLRGYVARKRFLKLKQVSTYIQRRFRTTKNAETQRSLFLAKKRSSIVIQSWFKMRIQARKYQALTRNVIRLQSLVRGYLVRKRLETETTAVRTIQQKWRSVLCVRRAVLQYQDQRNKVVLLQSIVRMHQQRARFTKLRSGVVLLQAHLRGSSVRTRMNNMNSAALIIQRRWRANVIMKKESLDYNRLKSSTVVLQSWVRMMLAKNKFLAIKRSAILIQALYRGKVVRSRVQLRESAARKIQQIWRATLLSRQTSMDYQKKRTSALIIQSYARMYPVRRKYELLQKSVMLIQSYYRGNRVRERIRQEHTAVTRIQRRWRATILARRTASNYRQKRACVTKIQTWYRMVFARAFYQKLKKSTVDIQAVVRGNKVRRELAEKRIAVTKIQRFWRSLMQCRREQQAYLRTREQIILIQSLARMNILRSKYSQMKKSAILLQALARGRRARADAAKKKQSVIKIQQHWISYREAKKQRENFRQLKISSINIQAWYRMVHARTMYMKLKSSTVDIQAVVRGNKVRRELAEKRIAVTKIQRFWRSLMQCRREQQIYLRTREQIILIQSLVRMNILRSKYSQMKKSAILLQALTRGRSTRAEGAKKKQSVIKIQQHWRSYREAKKQRENFCQLKTSAVKIQSQWRMTIASRRYKVICRSVLTLQKNVRTFLAVRSYQKLVETRRLQHECMVKSSLRIQVWYRSILVGREVRKNYLRERNLVISMQARTRGRVQRLKFLKLKTSTIKVQAQLRMKVEKRRFLLVKRSCVVLQRWYRSCQATRTARKSFLMTRTAAITLQTCVRRAQARRQFLEYKHSAVVLQSHARRLIAEKRFLELKRCTIMLQMSFRQKVLVRSDRNSFLLKKQAAVKIQSWWRMVQCRMSYLSVLDTIVILQANIRGYQARTKYANLKKAATTIQKHFRMHLVMREDRARFQRTRASVCLIQRTWRGCVARTRYNQHRRHVITLQNSIRGFLARKRLSELRRAKLEDTIAIKLQSWWRRFAAKKTMERLRREKAEARSAVIIQAAAKGFIARRSFQAKRAAACRIQETWRATLKGRRHRQHFLVQRSAAITIQARWRGYQGRTEYITSRQKIVICQSTVRMVQARKEYRRKIQAARIIQAGYRAYIDGQVARHNYLKTRRSLIAIQSWSRMIACRRRHVKQKSSAIVLQCWYRGFAARNKFLRLKRATLITQEKRRALLLCRAEKHNYQTKRNSAIFIQRVWKGLMARRKFLREREAAITIQRLTRGVIARRYVHRKRAALEIIQRSLRSYRAMKHQRSEFIVKRNSIVNLQRICRSYLARQEFRKLKEDAVYREQLRRECQRREEEKKNVAATVIVKTIRRYISHRKIVKRVICATVIQKYWRGYKSRVVMREKWTGLTSQLAEIRGRLEQATAAAEPKDRLGSRTASAIDYLFSIRDVAELIYAVKTLDMATRLSEDCCLKLSQGDNKPLGQLLNLINRCNRSVPHMEVVTISLDVLLNISRVTSTRENVCCIPNLVPDLFQIMVVYRDAGGSIFCKVCALLQILCKIPQINTDLIKPLNKKKLVDHQTRISTKQRLKEDSQKRRSFNVGAMPPPRKPGAVGNTSIAVTEKKRKGSSSLATGPPWNQDLKPRFHDDPNVAVTALIRVLEISKIKVESKD